MARIELTAGNDALNGTDDNDLFTGPGGGTDTLVGGSGDDVFELGDGTSGTISGGSGFDTVRVGSYRLGDDIVLRFIERLETGYYVALTSLQLMAVNEIAAPERAHIRLIGAGGGVDLSALESVSIYALDAHELTSGLLLAAPVSGLWGSYNYWSSLTEYDDRLSGGPSGDFVFGDDGDDLLLGSGGDDALMGGNGDDTVWGGYGNDVLGNSQRSTYVDDLGYDTGRNVYYGEAGNDFMVIGAMGVTTLYGGEGDDTFTMAYRGEGAIHGGAGVDRLSISSELSLVGLTEIDSVEVLEVIDSAPPSVTLSASQLARFDRVEAQPDILQIDFVGGEEFVDLSQVKVGVSYLWIGAHSGPVDIALPHASSITLYVSEFNDHIRAAGGNADQHNVFSGGAGDDTLVGGASGDMLDGNDGDDSLRGGGGNDTLVGGTGDDIAWGGDGNDVIGASGREINPFWGSEDEGRNVYYGGAGNDFLVMGYGGSTTLHGGAGDDQFWLGYSATGAVYGGDGTDRLTVPYSPALAGLGVVKGVEILEIADPLYVEISPSLLASFGEVRFKADTHRADIQLEGAGGFADLSRLKISTPSIHFYAGLEPINLILPNAFNIMLWGSEGNDIARAGKSEVALSRHLFGNLGDDSLAGGAGIDHLDGGSGDDTLSGGSGDDTLYGGDSTFESDLLIGGAGADYLVGTTMRGGVGDDAYHIENSRQLVVERTGEGTDSAWTSIDYRLTANVENLRIHSDIGRRGTGNAGANRIEGGAGDDTLSGWAGNDTLIGAEGADRLTGGRGRDKFVIGGPSDADADTIVDFRSGEDVVWLDRAALKDLRSSGPVTIEHFRLGPAARDADDRFIYDRARGALLYDADGSGAGAEAMLLARFGAGTRVTVYDLVVKGQLRSDGSDAGMDGPVLLAQHSAQLALTRDDIVIGG